MDKEPMLQMEHISKHFPGVQALQDVEFEVYPGEILGFMGENGAGKSTLVKILSGVYAKDTGTIRLRGQPVEIGSPHTAQALGITTIYQELALVPYLSVAENIFLNREPRRVRQIGMVDFKRQERLAEEILADLGLAISGKTLVNDLTVAAQQMVEIARAVSRNAGLILMDEPTSASFEPGSHRPVQPDAPPQGKRCIRCLHQPSPGRNPAGRRPHHHHARRPARRDAGHRRGHRREDHPPHGRPRGWPLSQGRSHDRRADPGGAQPDRRQRRAGRQLHRAHR